MKFEIQDDSLWNNIDKAKDDELEEIENYARAKGFKRLQFQLKATNPGRSFLYGAGL